MEMETVPRMRKPRQGEEMAHNMPSGMYNRYDYGYYGPYYGRITRSDAEIQDDIRNHLIWDSWVNADQIKVDVAHGVVTLTGEVDSVIEKRAAGDDAWDTPGVIDVINNLRIRRATPVQQG